MVGYRFASRDEWKSIRHYGTNERDRFWLEPPRNRRLLGGIVDHAIQNKDTSVLLLRADFPDRGKQGSLPNPCGVTRFFQHDKNLSPWVFRENERFITIDESLTPDRIQVVGEWELDSLPIPSPVADIPSEIKGYHFTSEAAWRSIREQGVKPHSFLPWNPEVAQILEKKTGSPNGIWTWTDIPTGFDLFGCVFDRCLHKLVNTVVLLELRFRKRDTINDDPQTTLSINHDGSLATESQPKWFYHKKKPATILRNTVPPSRVTKIAHFDMIEWAHAGLLLSRVLAAV